MGEEEKIRLRYEKIVCSKSCISEKMNIDAHS